MNYPRTLNDQALNRSSRGNAELGLCEHLATIFSSTSQYITLYLCVFVFQNNLFTLYCGLVNPELTANNTVSSGRTHLIWGRCFLCSAHQSFWHLGTLDSTLALCSGAILNNGITYNMWKKNKDVALSRPWKGHLFTVRADTRRQSFALFTFSKKHVYHQVTRFLFTHVCLSSNDEESTWSLLPLFGGPKFFFFFLSRQVCKYEINE